MKSKANQPSKKLAISNDYQDLRLAQESLEEYRANPASAIPWETLYKVTLQNLDTG